MWIRKSQIKELSKEVRQLIDGEKIDIRKHEEGVMQILRNDIHILANKKQEQVASLQRERMILKDTLADITHQLKTPLTSMIMMTDLLESATEEKQREFIHHMKTSLAQTEWLVTTLLKIAKLDTETVDFHLQQVASSELIQLAMQSLVIPLELKEQQIQVIGEELFFCDKNWTAEALGNILKNASEHSPVGTTITVEIGTNPLANWIRVTDSGKGMTKQEIAKVFQRFVTGKKTKGYGIGMPLALSIMRQQGGDIEVDGGGHGTGATFTLKFYK